MVTVDAKLPNAKDFKSYLNNLRSFGSGCEVHLISVNNQRELLIYEIKGETEERILELRIIEDAKYLMTTPTNRRDFNKLIELAERYAKIFKNKL